MYTTSLIFSLGIWKHADFFLLNQMSHEMLHPFIIIILVKLNLDPSPYPPLFPGLSYFQSGKNFPESCSGHGVYQLLCEATGSLEVGCLC